MDAFEACIELRVVRRFIPDELAFVRDYDARRTIDVPGVGEDISVNFWAPVMAAHLEAEGRLDDCETESDVLLALVDCLLETDFQDLTNSAELGDRSLELAIQIETLRRVLRDVIARN